MTHYQKVQNKVFYSKKKGKEHPFHDEPILITKDYTQHGGNPKQPNSGNWQGVRGQTGTLSNRGMGLTIMGALAQLLEVYRVGVEAHVREVPNHRAAALDRAPRPVLPPSRTISALSVVRQA